MLFDLSWLSLLFVSISWFAATKLYEPDARWFAVYITAALTSGLLAPVQPVDAKGKKSNIQNPRELLKLTLFKLKISVIHCAAIFAVQGAVFPFLYTVFAKYHKEPFITRLCAFFVSLAGAKNAAVDDYTLRLAGAYAPIDFSATWEKTGLFVFILIFIGGAALLFMRRANYRRYVMLFGICAAYLVFRYTALMLIYCQYQIHNIFWERVVTFISLAPLAFILSRCFSARDGLILSAMSIARGRLASPVETARRDGFASPGKIALHNRLASPVETAGREEFDYPEKMRGRRHSSSFNLIFDLLILVSVSLFVISSVAYFGLRDPGHKKAGRVVVDEYHSDWEWTDEAYDENWFGERSGYNYYCFYEYIDKFYETSRNIEPISKDLLSRTDILIIKTPTAPFDDAEVSAIFDFVGGGGGLYLIGDHTNVFGTGTNLNQIAPHFGIRFSYDCTYELTGGNLSEYDAPRLIPHPVVKDLPHFLFASSNTLETTMFTEDVIIGYGLKNFPADYSQKNFFPEDTNSGLIEFGAFIQSAAASYKRGRVLAFTDSTVFSNFWMHMRGKPELLLGALDWLNRTNVLPAAPRRIAFYFMIASAIILVAMLLLKKRLSPRTGQTEATFNARIILVAAASLLCGIVLFSAAARFGQLPEPIKPITNIRFENEYSDIELPINLSGFLADMDRQFSTFYVWTQRLGYVPSLSENLRAALSGAATERSVAVVSKPSKPFANEQEILKYVNEGAVLLILDNIASGGHSNGILRQIGMQIIAAPIQGPAEYDPSQNEERAQADIAASVISGINPTRDASSVTGGTALMRDAAGNALFSVMNVGLGCVAVFTDPDLFYNMELGDVSANLNEKTSLLTRLEFEIMKSLAETDSMDF